jgi:hypothetical protein
MVTFGLNEAGIKSGEFGIDGFEFGGQDLEFLAAPSFDKAATDEMIDSLVALAVPDGFHQAGYPRTRVRLTERDPPLFQEVEHKLEVLKLFDGDGVEVFNAHVEVAVFFEVQGAGRGFAFEVGVIDQDSRDIAEYFGEPIGGNFLSKQKHTETCTG